jgi:FMN-dependent NADH-azoreductase
MKLLHIDSSILGTGSVSRTLTAEIVAEQIRRHPGLETIYRDLSAEPVGHLSGAHLAAGQGIVPEARELREDIAAGQAALAEFLDAGIIVIGAPMYNFAVPSQLKAWIDRIAVAGKTFHYTANGPVGLAGDKQVIVASSRGGFYGPETPSAFLDHQENYLKGVFGFLGITDVSFIRAEGVNISPDQRAKSIEAAKAAIAQIAA